MDDAAPPAGPDALDILQDALATKPDVTAPEDMEEIPQIPYVKTDRVPEVALPLEAHVLQVLNDLDPDGEPYTAGRLRMLRGRTIQADLAAVTVAFAALFEVLTREGGTVAGHLAAFDGGGGMFAVGPVTDKADALARFDGTKLAGELPTMGAEPALSPLLELLQPAPMPELAEPRLGALGAKWTKITAKKAPRCDQCLRLIHDHGMQKAPAPLAAVQKRVGPNDTLHLCPVHAQDMREKDDAAKRQHDAAVAFNEHKKKAARARPR